MKERHQPKKFDKRAFGTKINKNAFYVQATLYILMGALCFLLTKTWSYQILAIANKLGFDSLPTVHYVLLNSTYPIHYYLALLLYFILATVAPPILYIIGFRTPYRKGNFFYFILLILLTYGSIFWLFSYFMTDINGNSITATLERFMLKQPLAFLTFYGSFIAAFTPLSVGIICVIVDQFAAINPLKR